MWAAAVACGGVGGEGRLVAAVSACLVQKMHCGRCNRSNTVAKHPPVLNQAQHTMHQGVKVGSGMTRTANAHTTAYQHHLAVKLMHKESLKLYKHSTTLSKTDQRSLRSVAVACPVPPSQAAPLPGRLWAPWLHTLTQALTCLFKGSCKAHLMQYNRFDPLRLILAIAESAPAAAAPIMVVRSGACVGRRHHHHLSGMQSVPRGFDACKITLLSISNPVWAEWWGLKVLYARCLAGLGV